MSNTPEADTAVPTATVLRLLQDAYAEGAKARERGPLVPHEGRHHAIGALLSVGISHSELQTLCLEVPSR